MLGQPDQLGWADTPLPHGLSYDSRLQVYNCFARWLKNETQRIEEEPPTAPEPDQTLWVSESGNVVRSFQGETPFTLNKKRAMERQPAGLERLLGVQRPAPGIQATILRRVPSRGVDLEAIEVPSAPKVWLPGWLFLPKTADRSKSVFLALEPTGRNVRWQEGGLNQSLAAKGYPVCSADVRGAGDLWPEFGRSAPRYARSHNDEENYAWASMIFGKPLVGQRVTDILALAAALRAHPALKGRRMVLAALSRMTVPALFAAALDSRIDRLYLAGGLVSFQAILETENYSCPFVNFVPDLLKYTDLPEVAASIGPRQVVLAGSVGADSRPLDVATVSRLYQGAGNVRALAEARWDPEALLSVGAG